MIKAYFSRDVYINYYRNKNLEGEMLRELLMGELDINWVTMLDGIEIPITEKNKYKTIDKAIYYIINFDKIENKANIGSFSKHTHLILEDWLEWREGREENENS